MPSTCSITQVMVRADAAATENSIAIVKMMEAEILVFIRVSPFLRDGKIQIVSAFVMTLRKRSKVVSRHIWTWREIWGDVDPTS